LDLLAKTHDLLPQAIPLWSLEHQKTDATDSIKAWHYYGTKVQLNGEDYYARFVVREANNGEIYYDGELTSVEKVNGLTGAILTKTGALAVSADDHTITHWLNYGNTYRQDETAEPSVLFKALAKFGGAFRYGKPRGKTVEAITKSINKDLKARPMSSLRTKNGTEIKRWVIDTVNGRPAFLQDNGRNVWLNVEPLKAGESSGSAIYAIAAAYAYNNNKVFIGDPAGASEKGFYRRLENMISSALKYGTTDHIKPQRAQLDPYKYYKNKLGEDSKWLKQFKGDEVKLNWIDGNYEHNLAEMLRVAYNIASRDFPQLKNYVYDFTTNKFIDRTADSHAELNIKSIGDEFRLSLADKETSNSGGRATVARAILYNTALEEGYAGGLDNALRLIQRNGRDATGAKRPLHEIFYQTNSGLSAEDAG
jgi:hypothetical protein